MNNSLFLKVLSVRVNANLPDVQGALISFLREHHSEDDIVQALEAMHLPSPGKRGKKKHGSVRVFEGEAALQRVQG